MRIEQKVKQVEFWNMLSHGLGAGLSVIGLAVLIGASWGNPDLTVRISVVVFGLSMTILYTSSALYHGSVTRPMRHFFKRFDHIAIYYLIAGTYTPLVLVVLHGSLGWTLFALIWGFAFLGTYLKLCVSENGMKVWSIALYIGMGWLISAGFDRLWMEMPRGAFFCLLFGGVMYTAGVLFYVWRSRPVMHAVWHVFVLTGSILHYFAILYGCVLN